MQHLGILLLFLFENAPYNSIYFVLEYNILFYLLREIHNNVIFEFINGVIDPVNNLFKFDEFNLEAVMEYLEITNYFFELGK